MGEILRRLLAVPRVTLELVVASLVANILALALPLFVIQVLNRYVAHGIDETLATLCAGAIIAVFLEFGIRRERFKLARIVSLKPDAEAANIGFNILTAAKGAVLDRISPAKKMEVMGSADNIRNAYSATNISTVLDVPFAFLFIGVLYLLSPQLALIVASFVVISFFAGIFTLLSLRKPTREMIDENRTSNAYVGAAIQEPDTIRAFNAASFLRQAWSSQSNTARGLYNRIVARQGTLGLITQSLTGVMSIAVIAVGALLVVRGELNVGALIGANILAARALQPITRFSQLGEVFVKAKYSENLLKEFSKLMLEPTSGSMKESFNGEIEFRDLAFAHPGATGPLFESLSLKIPPGSLIIVIGDNGSGKSTLARLLVGLIEPSRGQILVDGLDLRQTNPLWWRQQVMYLPQEPGFLNTSLETNLKALNPNIDDDALSRIIDAVALRNYIDESPQGLAMPVIEYGRHLSVGIRRRLALARALTSDGMLAVFDEPTEGVDRKGFDAVVAIIDDLRARGRTIIASTDNPVICAKADLIIDLNSKPTPAIKKLKSKKEAGSMTQKILKSEIEVAK